MAPANRANWDQVADIFGLDSNYRAEALRISSITGDDNRYYALVCLNQKARQESVKNSTRSHLDWTPKATLADELKKMLRLILRDSSIESYTDTLNSSKTIISGSFHRKAMQAIMNQTDSWKAEFLPPDFGTTLDDLFNHDKFIKFLKAKLRHARDDFRAEIMTNIWVPKSKINEPQIEVPDLESLLGLLYRFFDRNESRTPKELKRQVDAKTQARFAYLRIEISIYHDTSLDDRKKNGGLTYWGLIDRKLAELRDKSREHRRAFNAVVLARDQGLFNGKNKWDKIKSDDKLEVPTQEDVLTAIPFLPGNAS
ncbi:uncharacterized protein MELLADRAFT_88647 [Melampsora larici-populina 98AG31]|uniref:Uncharacterized protein n=1 Tax=Melampsora larici-populina (strain 98AG31 / pathotype 3-4-7) TaxID=747676 RepID=F4RSH0_MELLP|nr:uncharacterized protein MELLADRAFT_88647 [Melampsora larici-populina 98AG31]EGG04597.1 hypothetical protein MELLADRAFT_88647 [Melampsora larici-populina 98AG31]